MTYNEASLKINLIIVDLLEDVPDFNTGFNGSFEPEEDGSFEKWDMKIIRKKFLAPQGIWATYRNGLWYPQR